MMIRSVGYLESHKSGFVVRVYTPVICKVFLDVLNFI